MTDSSPPPLASLRRLAIATTASVFLLIAIGGFVRAAGAGLGCEDWPRCFAWSRLPPLSIDDVPLAERGRVSIPKAWIEYVNRLLGVVIGLLIVATWIAAFRGARDRKDVFRRITLALLLVAFQGWQGGMVVRMRLDPRIVSVHLFLGLMLAMLMVYATVNTGLDRPYEHRPDRWSR